MKERKGKIYIGISILRRNKETAFVGVGWKKAQIYFIRRQVEHIGDLELLVMFDSFSSSIAKRFVVLLTILILF